MTTIPRIKICCIADLQEAKLAIRFGASALGLVSEMPSGPGVISEERIAEIAATIPPAVSAFLLTCKKEAAAIVAQQRRCGVNTLQLCDSVTPECLQELRHALPGIAVVQVVHVRGEASIQQAEAIASFVDGLLLDSGDPDLPVQELGGTGRTHNWQISKRIRQAVGVPVFLAGGLNAGNVADAIKTVEPFGVDVCSGVRTQGKLDESKLAKFVSNVKSPM